MKISKRYLFVGRSRWRRLLPVTGPRKLVTITPETARRIDDYRFGQRIGSESEALRRLIGIGLNLVNQGHVPKQETRPE